MLSEFPVIIELPVQWGDQDALGHVNNVVFFRWWESSRVAWCEEAGLIRRSAESLLPTSIGSVLASIQCDFRRQLVYPDRVRIGARAARIGNSSLRIEHRLVSESLGEIAAEAVSTIVMFDFATQQSIRVPDVLRQGIRQLEGDRPIDGL